MSLPPRIICLRKTRYGGRKAALRARDRHRLRNPDVPLNIYRCRVCGRWHLTSSCTSREDSRS